MKSPFSGFGPKGFREEDSDLGVDGRPKKKPGRRIDRRGLYLEEAGAAATHSATNPADPVTGVSQNVEPEQDRSIAASSSAAPGLKNSERNREDASGAALSEFPSFDVEDDPGKAETGAVEKRPFADALKDLRDPVANPAPVPKPKSPSQAEIARRASAQVLEDIRKSQGEAALRQGLRPEEWAGALPGPVGDAVEQNRQKLQSAIKRGKTGEAFAAVNAIGRVADRALGPNAAQKKRAPDAVFYDEPVTGYAQDLRESWRLKREGRADPEAEHRARRIATLGQGVPDPVDRPDFWTTLHQEEARAETSAQPPVVLARQGAMEERPSPDATRSPTGSQGGGRPSSAPSASALTHAAGAGLAAKAGEAAIVAAETGGGAELFPVAPVRGASGGAVGAAKKALRFGGLALAADIAANPNLPGWGGLGQVENFDFDDGVTIRFMPNGARVGDGGSIGAVRRQQAGGERGETEELLASFIRRRDEQGDRLFIEGAEALGPVARLEDGLLGGKRLVLLRPDLFDGASGPRAAEQRAKAAHLRPLILGGRLPGYGEGVRPERFAEAFDPPVLDIGPLVTPLPKARGPELTITPDESDRIARQYLDWAQKGGFSPAPEELRRPLVVEIRAPYGGLNEGNAWGLLDQVRGKLDAHPLISSGVRRAGPRNLPALGDEVARKGDSVGTAAVVQVGGQIFVGVNSGALNDRRENLTPGRLVREQLGLRLGAHKSAFHAESDALIRAYFRTKGALPRELTLYVDRDTCNGCKEILPDVIEAIGVDRLTIVMKSGERIAPIPRRGLMQE